MFVTYFFCHLPYLRYCSKYIFHAIFFCHLHDLKHNENFRIFYVYRVYIVICFKLFSTISILSYLRNIGVSLVLPVFVAHESRVRNKTTKPRLWPRNEVFCCRHETCCHETSFYHRQETSCHETSFLKSPRNEFPQKEFKTCGWRKLIRDSPKILICWRKNYMGVCVTSKDYSKDILRSCN